MTKTKKRRRHHPEIRNVTLKDMLGDSANLFTTLLERQMRRDGKTLQEAFSNLVYIASSGYQGEELTDERLEYERRCQKEETEWIERQARKNSPKNPTP